ncbi:carboxypeptidase-like regulatory domain-containing protein [Rufibacter immobilis]|uniref:Carboxypeptidase-like regulatory domain-containing protein n=1 Tax=Rufibacter immobilis TaxID=1348778 RepID=A0A3M9MXM6_9BACT|nr:carboxypeptidase-like regulatory domain-containing protein [Rufibacter immobilis]RNI30302.1 carboxypeptidase-like regulatory domain-containing protein [Rufibacter immobilis]
MPVRRLTLSVPKPCQENWQDMTPQNQGRFCQSCATTVVDFSTMTNAEIVAFLGKANGRVCGSFHLQQLGQEFLLRTSTQRNRTWRAVALGIATWLSTKPVYAQETVAPPAIEQNPSLAAANIAPQSQQPVPDSLATIRGKVISGDGAAPMPGVTVMWKGTTDASPTNAEGVFTISIPPDIPEDQLILSVSFIGYSTQELRLKEILKQKNLVIRLNPDARTIGEVVVIPPSLRRSQPQTPATPKKAGFFQKLKGLFR